MPGTLHGYALIALALTGPATASGQEKRGPVLHYNPAWLAPQASDPIEGKWLGLAGFPQDRVTIGFEFKRDDKQGIAAYWYSPVTNFYGLKLSDTVQKADRTFRVESVFLSVVFEGDSLVGTYYPLKAPIVLHRTKTLPAETPLPNLPRGPEPVWQTKLGAAIYAAPAVYEGAAYAGTTSGTLYAVDVATGKPIWGFLAGRPIHGAALATADALYFVCDNGLLFKLDRARGREQWRYELGDAQTPRVLAHPLEEDFDWDLTAARPVLSDGVIYVGSGDGGFNAVDAGSGKRVWRFQTHGRIRTDALVSGDTVFVGSFDGSIYTLERRTGRQIWSKNTRAAVTSTPALAGGWLIMGNRGGVFGAVDTRTAETRWRTLFWGSSVESDPVAYDDLLYVGSSNLRRVTALDPRDGRVIWRTDVYGLAWSRPVVTKRFVYSGAASVSDHPIRHLASLTALDRQTGKIVWRWPMPECSGCLMSGFIGGGTLSGRTLIIGGLNGSLYAFPVDVDVDAGPRHLPRTSS